MMDERLISEVQKHAIIYNRQKNNMINGDKSANKELAWTKIAINLGTDPDSCKKRWKYLRERYVQQKKVGDSPSYEHLSRPYLEKMRFLDHFIQPRKSYRNVGHLLTSPNNSQHSLMDGGSNDESSRLERTIQMSQMLHTFQTEGSLADVVHHQHHHHHPNLGNNSTTNHHNSSNNNNGIGGAALSSASADESAYNHYYRFNAAATSRSHSTDTGHQAMPLEDHLRHIPPPAPDLIKNEITHPKTSSSSSSLVSSQPSPAATSGHAAEMLDEMDGQKRRRTNVLEQHTNNTNHHNNISHSHHAEQSLVMNNNNLHNLSDADAEEEQSSTNNGDVGDADEMHRSPPFPSDFLYPFYQHAHAQRQHQQQQQQQQQVVRNSEQLLGELVTSELLKMSKERKKLVQKKILEILFFDD